MKKVMLIAAAVIFSASVFAATGSKMVTSAPQTAKTAKTTHKKEAKKTTKKGTAHKKGSKKSASAKKA